MDEHARNDGEPDILRARQAITDVRWRRRWAYDRRARCAGGTAIYWQQARGRLAAQSPVDLGDIATFKKQQGVYGSVQFGF